MNFNWYWNRLKTMSVPELAFRVGQQSKRRNQKKKYTGYAPQKTLLSPPQRLLDIPDIEVEDMSSRFDILGIEWDYSEPVNWHLDLQSGREFPKVFCRDVNTRSDEAGIAKYVWEPNRHQFLTKIALQYRATRDHKYLDLFRSLLQSWKEQNPYLIGVNWYSNIEVNVRLITWFLAWEILDVNAIMETDEEFAAFVNEDWVPLIYLHCKYSHDFPSKYSSANNHRISEGAGLFLASTYWQFEESPAWLRSSKKILEQEMLLQHSREGVNKEETSEYIQFITDYFLIALVVADRSDNPFSGQYRERLFKVFDYIYHLMDIGGRINHYGDGDDGRTFMLETEPDFSNYKSLMASAATIFGNEKFKARAAGYDSKNAVLFGAAGKEKYDALGDERELRSSRFYIEEGHFLMRKEDEQGEVMLHMDVAPLGFLAIAAHGHADALSFYMGVDGKFIFTDPGTFSYHTDMPWRNYFVSTLAHNTIEVEGQSQALRGGPTMWLDHYRCELLRSETGGDEDLVVASHNGYRKLGITHTRSIRFDKNSLTFEITDTLKNKSGEARSFKIPFHLHPDVRIGEKGEKNFVLSTEGARDVYLEMDGKLEVEIIKGQTDPILGWFSRRFYAKTAAPVILGSGTVTGSLELKTRIRVRQ